jgi:hypothetical protein
MYRCAHRHLCHLCFDRDHSSQSSGFRLQSTVHSSRFTVHSSQFTVHSPQRPTPKVWRLRRPPSSDLRPPSSVLRLQSSVLRPPSSVLRPLISVLSQKTPTLPYSNTPTVLYGKNNAFVLGLEIKNVPMCSPTPLSVHFFSKNLWPLHS